MSRKIESEPEVIEPGEISGIYVDKGLSAPTLGRTEIPVSRSAYAITFVAGLNAGWFGALLPALTKAQHLPLEQGGILASAVCAGGFVALAASSKIIAGLGDLKTTLLAAALAAAGFFGLGSIGGLYALTACAFCYGLGVGLNSISSHIIFPRYYPQKVASALSKLNSFYGLGALSGPMIALSLVNLKINYNWIFLGAGLYAALICAYLLSAHQKLEVGEEKRHADARSESGKTPQTQPVLSILKHPILIGLASINFLYVGVECTLGTWIYSFLQKAESFDNAVASAAISLLWLGLTLGRMTSTRACLTFNPKYVTMTAMLILTATLFLIANIHSNQNLTLLVVLLIGVGLGPIFPTIIAQSATRFPKDSSTTTAVIISAGCIGGMVLPWLGGNALVGYGATNFMILTAITASVLPIILGLTLFPIGGRAGLARENES
ncbi:MAG: MFS transporter [Cyanobacteria bacterium SZAS LIN-3]|nr:MFS transporter [Cyanobacteria bacterium SZAS LIN-3]